MYVHACCCWLHALHIVGLVHKSIQALHTLCAFASASANDNDTSPPTCTDQWLRTHACIHLQANIHAHVHAHAHIN